MGHGVLGVDNTLLLAVTCKAILEKSDLAQVLHQVRVGFCDGHAFRHTEHQAYPRNKNGMPAHSKAWRSRSASESASR